MKIHACAITSMFVLIAMASAPADIKQAFTDADKDGNGSLSLDEFVKHVDDSKNHGEQRFGRADRNEDGILTRDELTRYLQKKRGAIRVGAGESSKDKPQSGTRKPATKLAPKPKKIVDRILPVQAGGRRPNIVVVLTDDQGYADVSYNPLHAPQVKTPQIDKLARAGVICTQGYTTGHVCSPTRAGLMTGRYQQRFGIYTAGEGGSGVPLNEVFFSEYLKQAGYVTGAFGKWHLGLTSEYNASNRGFDEFYGFMGRGAHDYFKHDDPTHPIYRGLKPIQDSGYLTHRITDEAVDFVRRHKDKPFFAYVAYNAVHAPAQAPPGDVKVETGDETRGILMAMLRHLDTGVGQIADAIKDAGVWDNTLFIFLTDNGGAGAMKADNSPLRGFKQMDYEGGVHVPFFVSWPEELAGGTTCDVPVTSIDLLPTALAAAGVVPAQAIHLDGKDMLPALSGKTDKLHDVIYWSSAGKSGKWAVRRDDWKLVGQKDKHELFNLAKDLSETTDLSGKHPDKVSELKKLHDAWLDQMAPPVNGAAKRWDPNQIDPKQKMKSKPRKK